LQIPGEETSPPLEVASAASYYEGEQQNQSLPRKLRCLVAKPARRYCSYVCLSASYSSLAGGSQQPAAGRAAVIARPPPFI